MSRRQGLDLSRSAVVFAPHPDDETLGCGGTVIRKRAAGADVRIVFMTDGGRSHEGLRPGHELQVLRRREAVAAARTLGVDEVCVSFLDFEDGRLGDLHARAVPEVAAILNEFRPEEVFVPYHGDPPADHVATYRIVRTAVEQTGPDITVYEYPIWFWRFWPLTEVNVNRTADVKTQVICSLARTKRLIRDFRWQVSIAEVVEQKRRALAEHRSQMTRLDGDPRWLTLGDVSGGEFLECFFGEYEVFALANEAKRGNVECRITDTERRSEI